MRHLRFASAEQLQLAHAWLGAAAQQLEQANAKAKFDQWQAWVVNQTDKTGAALIHKFIRGPTPWTEYEGHGGPQENADVRAQTWHREWLVEAAPATISWPPLDEWPSDGVLDDIEAFRDVAGRFKRGTAIGADWLHPRHYAMLSDGTIRALLMLYRVCV